MIQDLEVYGNVSIFGDVEASDIPPSNVTPEQVISTVGQPGSTTAYARGDHSHQLAASTLDTILESTDFSSSVDSRFISAESDIDNLQIDSASFSSRVTDNETNITSISSYTSSLATNLHNLTETEVTELLNINDITITNTQ